MAHRDPPRIRGKSDRRCHFLEVLLWGLPIVPKQFTGRVDLPKSQPGPLIVFTGDSASVAGKGRPPDILNPGLARHEVLDRLDQLLPGLRIEYAHRSVYPRNHDP